MLILVAGTLEELLAVAVLEVRAQRAYSGAAVARARELLATARHDASVRGGDPGAGTLRRLAVIDLAQTRTLPLAYRTRMLRSWLVAGDVLGIDRNVHRQRWIADRVAERAIGLADQRDAAREAEPAHTASSDEPAVLPVPVAPDGAGRVLSEMRRFGGRLLSTWSSNGPRPERRLDTGTRAAACPGQPLVTVVGDLRLDVSDDANLVGAWEKVRDNARSKDAWTEELGLFEQDLLEHLAELRTSILAERWAPGRARPVAIPKRSGGVRRLHVPSVADRVAERAIAQVLSSLVDPHLSPWSFAFRPGRGVDDAIRSIAEVRDDGATHVVRFDVARCFDNLDRAQLMSSLARFVADPWLLRVVGRIVDRELSGLPRDRGLVGIAQGSPLSPLLANLALDELDSRLLRAGYPAVRYADDLVMPCRSAADARDGLAVAEASLAAMHLGSHQEKTAIASFADTFEYLGALIGADVPASAPLPERPPRDRSLYVTPRAGYVSLRRGHIRVTTREREELLSVPVSVVGRLILMGPIGLSPGLRSHSLRHGIDVAFLSRAGNWLGRLDGGAQIDGALRRQQYVLTDGRPQQLEVARAIVSGKVANQRALLQRAVRRRVSRPTSAAADRLASCVSATAGAEDLDELRGLEGAAANAYFAALRDLFPEAAGFDGRNRRPPRDPANAALSFGYALLTNEAHAAVASSGLEPHVGFLQAESRRRPSLALDLMEEFRPVVVDSVVLALFRRRQLRTEHFTRPAPDRGVRLTEKGRRIFIDAYERRMLTRFHHPPLGGRLDYRRSLGYQAGQLAAIVAGERPTYVPVAWR